MFWVSEARMLVGKALIEILNWKNNKILTHTSSAIEIDLFNTFTNIL